jgi:hypothetical protein
LIAFLNMKNDDIREMHIFPDMNRTRRFHVTADNTWMKRGDRLETLSQFLDGVKAVSQKR